MEDKKEKMVIYTYKVLEPSLPGDVIVTTKGLRSVIDVCRQPPLVKCPRHYNCTDWQRHLRLPLPPNHVVTPDLPSAGVVTLSNLLEKKSFPWNSSNLLDISISSSNLLKKYTGSPPGREIEKKSGILWWVGKSGKIKFKSRVLQLEKLRFSPLKIFKSFYNN